MEPYIPYKFILQSLYSSIHTGKWMGNTKRQPGVQLQVNMLIGGESRMSREMTSSICCCSSYKGLCHVGVTFWNSALENATSLAVMLKLWLESLILNNIETKSSDTFMTLIFSLFCICDSKPL